jgi:hypothetical protein
MEVTVIFTKHKTNVAYVISLVQEESFAIKEYKKKKPHLSGFLPLDTGEASRHSGFAKSQRGGKDYSRFPSLCQPCSDVSFGPRAD